jgi:hypothetical protein
MNSSRVTTEFHAQFKVFHELMAQKVREILLVSSPYDAFILEEDGSLASRIINEYSGLNLSLPPRVTRTASVQEALERIEEKAFDLVVTMPFLGEMDARALSAAVKEKQPDLPVILLAHSPRTLRLFEERGDYPHIDRLFVWTGNSDLLLALVKHVEDALNVERDTRRAMVRVLIFVEDSAVYSSAILPLLYKEIVQQTQAVLKAGLNEEHRLLTMRARPKILMAETYEEAERLYEKYRDYLFGIISDARFPRGGTRDPDAGFRLLRRARKEIPDLPLLMLSSQPENREAAGKIPAVFLDKNAPNLMEEIHDFFLTHLGFGDFVFRTPEGREIGRARDLRELAEKVKELPDESLRYHADRNHFSNWIMSRSEIALASRLGEKHTEDFDDLDEVRRYIISNVQALRLWRQRGVVARFSRDTYDGEVMDFVRTGDGSLGGKARGLAFMLGLLHEESELHDRYPGVAIGIPKSLVIGTDGFLDFVRRNGLRHLAEEGVPDERVRDAFLAGSPPDWLVRDLEVFLSETRWPLSVRSSSRLEDAHFQPYAGLYATRMIPNNRESLAERLDDLLTAVKEVYASTYCQGPKAFSRSTGNKHREEAMAVIIQQLTGSRNGDHFYPTLSGVLQSHNFYPVGPMTPEDGVAHVALGLGKTVVEGERSLRFCPRYPEVLPQFSSVDDTLDNAQRYFYALRMTGDDGDRLERLEVDEAEKHPAVRALSSVYVPEEHRLRDSGGPADAPRVLTFAPVLKHGRFPLADILCDFLELGQRAMGCPVEIEFAADLATGGDQRDRFHFLQMRPLVTHQDQQAVEIADSEMDAAICHSQKCLGNGRDEAVADVVYVRLDNFEARKTKDIAREIGKLNAELVREDRPYLLIGPGRWGTSDPFLGIPVQWRDISGVRAMVELRGTELQADPSQGSHFFQNITSLGVFYLTVDPANGDRIDWEWLKTLETVRETENLRHVRAERPLRLKADGRRARCVILPGAS